MATMNAPTPKPIWLYAVLLAAFTLQAGGSQQSTKLAAIAEGVANCMEAFAKEHNGKAPTTWSELNAYIDLDRVAINLGGSLESQMLLVWSNHPKLPGAGELELVAVTSFPINEDRRTAVGRYVVYRKSDGRFFSRWESEDTIRASLSKVDTQIPTAAIFKEKPLKALSVEYSIKLIEEAVKQGVPVEKAAEVVEKHVSDVANGHRSPANSWDEIASQTTGTSPSKAKSSKQPPIAPPPDTPRSWLVWLLVVIVAMIGATWLLLRKSK